jgi:hypothetical protein
MSDGREHISHECNILLQYLFWVVFLSIDILQCIFENEKEFIILFIQQMGLPLPP